MGGTEYGSPNPQNPLTVRLTSAMAIGYTWVGCGGSRGHEASNEMAFPPQWSACLAIRCRSLHGIYDVNSKCLIREIVPRLGDSCYVEQTHVLMRPRRSKWKQTGVVHQDEVTWAISLVG